MDTACNKTLVGEKTMLLDKKDLETNHSLSIIIEDANDSFTFGEGSSRATQVHHKAVRPVGICGYSGEVEGAVIPNADTSWLFTKGDLHSVGTKMLLEHDKHAFKKLRKQYRGTHESRHGHLVMDINDSGKDGHQTPVDFKEELLRRYAVDRL